MEWLTIARDERYGHIKTLQWLADKTGRETQVIPESASSYILQIRYDGSFEDKAEASRSYGRIRSLYRKGEWWTDS